MRAIWKRTGKCLYPASAEAEEILRTMKHGAEVLCELKKPAPRNIRQLKLYWVLMGLLVEHDLFPTREAASDCVKFAVGHVDARSLPDTGEVELVPRSIAFERMKQVEFNTFFAAVIRAVCDRWLPGVDDETLRMEVYALIDGPERSSLGKRVDVA